MTMLKNIEGYFIWVYLLSNKSSILVECISHIFFIDITIPKMEYIDVADKSSFCHCLGIFHYCWELFSKEHQVILKMNIWGRIASEGMSRKDALVCNI